MENSNISKLIKQLPQNTDAVMITSSVNRFYFTGMKSSAGTLFITKEKSYFIIDFRYIELAKKTVKNCEVILQANLYEQIEEIIKKHNIKNISIESGYISCEDFIGFEKALPNTKFNFDNNVNDIIKDIRQVKSEQELECMIKAQKITDESFKHILTFIKAGLTEKEVELEFEFYARSHGAESVSFDFIVVAGEKSSLPHGVPGDNIIKDGDFITMDVGVKVGGYCSDMTRTVAVGHVTDEQKHVYNTVLKANLEAEKAVRAGMECYEVDKIARDIITEAGFGDSFGHGLGHSVGVEIHEAPFFNTRCHTILKENTVMTVEPGIYLEGKFGVRIEDMVVITKDGCKILTQSPKELIIL